MKCPKCGITYFDERGTCPSCGNMLPVNNTEETQQVNESAVEPQTPVVQSKPEQVSETTQKTEESTTTTENAPVKEKKSPLLLIVIIILVVIAAVLIALVYLDINKGKSVDHSLYHKDEEVPLINNETTNETGDNNTTPEIGSDENTVISLYGMSFRLPEGFQYLFENEYYEVYNSTLKKVFILDNMYKGNSKDLEQGLSLMKAEYAENGCKDIETSTGLANDINYGYVSYTLEGKKIEEVYALIDDKYIMSFYNVETILVSTDDFIKYTTLIANSGSGLSNLSPSNEPDDASFERKIYS